MTTTAVDTFTDVIRSRRSARAFLPDPVPADDIRGVLEDADGRTKAVAENLRFYGAPHVALLFVPELGDVVRAANDVGMYAQNFLLSLTARGYHGVPQGMHGLFADTVRAHLGLPADRKLLYGISFGTADPEASVNRLDLGRAPLDEHIVLHDTSL